MTKLMITGGQRRIADAAAARPFTFKAAKVLELDLESGAGSVLHEYQCPPDVCADTEPNILFKAGTVVGDNLYICTETEVLTLRLPDLKQVGYVSLSCFNDVHHCTPTPDGNILVANTGLDMVVEVTPGGEVLRQWDVLGRPLWSRFSPDVDYRKVASTKPHDSHPNYVFMVDDDVWVTRCCQRDAVCLTTPDRSVPLRTVEMYEEVDCGSHDGVMYEGRAYFTTVNGHVVVADPRSCQVLHDYDLNKTLLRSLGWCRGICLLNENLAVVGFTRLRQTSERANLGWLNGGINHLKNNYLRPTRIALYDLPGRKVLREFDLEKYAMHAVFSILPFTPTGSLEKAQNDCQHASVSE